MAGTLLDGPHNGLEASGHERLRIASGLRAMNQKRADEYRRKAEEYRVKAGIASGEHDKTAWLKLADDWQQLADLLRQCAPDSLPHSKLPLTR
jgi:hypothetical protein